MAQIASAAAVIESPRLAIYRTRAPSPWVRGPVWDGFWMLSALWLAPIVLWLAHRYADPESSPLDVLYFGLTHFLIGHVCSTYGICTEAYRPPRAQPIFRRAPHCSNRCLFCLFLPGDLHCRGREERLGDWRLSITVGNVVIVLGRFRFTATRWTEPVCSNVTPIFALCVGGAPCYRGCSSWSGRLSGEMDRSLVFPWLVAQQDAIRYGGLFVLLAATIVMLAAELRRQIFPAAVYTSLVLH
jgi:hypothetical protein